MQTHVGAMLVASVFVSSYAPCSVDLGGLVLLVSVLSPLALKLSASYSVGHPKLLEKGFDREVQFRMSLCMISNYGCLWVSAVRGSLSDNGWLRHRSMSISEYH